MMTYITKEEIKLLNAILSSLSSKSSMKLVQLIERLEERSKTNEVKVLTKIS